MACCFSRRRDNRTASSPSLPSSGAALARARLAGALAAALGFAAALAGGPLAGCAAAGATGSAASPLGPRCQNTQCQ